MLGTATGAAQTKTEEGAGDNAYVHFLCFDLQGLHIGLTNSLAGPDRKSGGAADAQQLSGYDYVMYGKVFKLEETSSERR